MWELYDVTLWVIVSFKSFMMNFVNFMFDCYSHITSHVSQVFASFTHYTSYSLLNFVHYIVCDLVMAIQDYMFLDFDRKCDKIFGLSLPDLIVIRSIETE